MSERPTPYTVDDEPKKKTEKTVLLPGEVRERTEQYVTRERSSWDLGLSAERVFRAISTYPGSTVNQLAGLTRLSRLTVMRAIRNLEQDKWLEAKRTKGMKTRYTILSVAGRYVKAVSKRDHLPVSKRDCITELCITDKTISNETEESMNRPLPEFDPSFEDSGPSRPQRKRKVPNVTLDLATQYKALFEARTALPYKSLGYPLKVMSGLLADGWTQEEISNRLKFFFDNDFYASRNYTLALFKSKIGELVAARRQGFERLEIS